MSFTDAQTPPSVTLNPNSIANSELNQQFTIDITVSNIENLWGWNVNVTWDSRYLKYIGTSEGSFLSDVAQTLFLPSQVFNFTDALHNQDTYRGIKLSCAISENDKTASGTGILATLTFQAIRPTSSAPITLTVEHLKQPNPSDSDPDSPLPQPEITPANQISTAQVSLLIPGPPTANGGKDQVVQVGQQVTFNASQSVSTGNNTQYTWTFNDGTPKNLTGMVATYTFSNPGNYSVLLTVQDSLGTDNSTVIIHVLGDSASTPTPTETPSTVSPTPTSSLDTSNPSPTPKQSPSTGSFTLPPIILGIIVFLTMFVVIGSFYWLRRQQ